MSGHLHKIAAGLLLALFSVPAAWALGPHEVLLLANANAPDSVEIAMEYARLRKIPAANLVTLKLPRQNGKTPIAISPPDFTEYIWQPAVKAARERGIDDHILAWVYSSGFPFRTDRPPRISITGLTFLRNRMPGPKEVGQAAYVSPLFTGPSSPKGNLYAPKSFDTAREFLREEMPLPAMMLGYRGERGNTKKEILNCLKTGLWSDGTHPRGTVYFALSNDVRTRCRQWEFPIAMRGLQKQGVSAVVTNGLPVGKRDVIGLMAGKANLDPFTIGGFLPGCMAEHLTSYGAAFGVASQTKISRWIAAGATASSGTVSEPMSLWPKFPNAVFFNHYAYGCTMIESFYQSLRSPLQILLVGEPLAAPWAPGSEVSLQISNVYDNELLRLPREINLRVKTNPGISFSKFVYLVDGRIRGQGRAFTLDPTNLKPGRHSLRAVAYRTGFVRSQIFDVKEFRTERQP